MRIAAAVPTHAWRAAAPSRVSPCSARGIKRIPDHAINRVGELLPWIVAEQLATVELEGQLDQRSTVKCRSQARVASSRRMPIRGASRDLPCLQEGKCEQSERSIVASDDGNKALALEQPSDRPRL